MRFNWRLWSGLALCILAPLGYFVVFVQYAPTRDVPWPSFLLFAVGVALLISGWRRAPRKIVASIVTALGLVVLGLFTFVVTIGSKNLPASAAAPKVGQKAPGFALPDTRGRTTSLPALLADSNGVLLVFYRGYW